MPASRSLPVRPSLEALRKQAKTLKRDTATRDADAVARVRAALPQVALPLTLRNAQLVIAREYGYPGWRALTEEVGRRLGRGLDEAAERARQVIHDNHLEGLKQLISEHPALLAWPGDGSRGGVLAFATDAYGDAGDPGREQWFTRAACAEWLIDAGAVVTPAVLDGLIASRARGLLDLFHRKDRLPRTVRFLAALGDRDGVEAALAAGPHETAAVVDAFTVACRFGRTAVASFLLDRAIALDPELGRRVDRGPGRPAFVADHIETHPIEALSVGPWRAFVLERQRRAVGEGDLGAFVAGLRDEAWLLDDAWVGFQDELITMATLNGREPFIAALLDVAPAITRRQPPPPSQAIEHAFVYGHAHLIPVLTRIWPLPDDLPHAAGMGDRQRVQRWFDAEGRPALGDPGAHAPATSVHPREPQWGPVGVQQVLDTALAWAVINRRFEVADFLIAHGADVSTNWNSHEPASILHHLVFLPDPYERMRYLIDRGIDLTIRDYRWKSTAAGWARHGHGDEGMAAWLDEAERRRRT